HSGYDEAAAERSYLQYVFHRQLYRISQWWVVCHLQVRLVRVLTVLARGAEKFWNPCHVRYAGVDVDGQLDGIRTPPGTVYPRKGYHRGGVQRLRPFSRCFRVRSGDSTAVGRCAGLILDYRLSI